MATQKLTFVPLTADEQCEYAIRLTGRTKADLTEMARVAGYRSEEIASDTKAQLAIKIAHKAVKAVVAPRATAPCGLLLGDK